MTESERAELAALGAQTDWPAEQQRRDERHVDRLRRHRRERPLQRRHPQQPATTPAPARPNNYHVTFPGDNPWTGTVG